MRAIVTIMVTLNLIVVMMVTMRSGQLASPPPNQDEDPQKKPPGSGDWPRDRWTPGPGRTTDSGNLGGPKWGQSQAGTTAEWYITAAAQNTFGATQGTPRSGTVEDSQGGREQAGTARNTLA